ncbi:FCD domain-containing protein [Roseobacter sp. WL0113]|uniref:FCD domain-containing protein n=1 Tax=Roseobacter sinensis TaxID=2931391 RepID=A0ABT3BKY3_9RHOB|nr:FCD domain-containing protein [Roseobacter sp. WL0113]
MLEDENELWRHVGQGTFLGPRPVAAPRTETLRLRVTSADQLIRARLLIEPAIAAEAARRATPADMEKLRDCVAAGRRGVDRFVCQQADDEFHRMIADAARNPILSSVLDFLSDARRRSPWQTLWDRTYRRVGIEEFRTVHSDQHAELVSSIERHEPDRAEAAMRDHLTAIVAMLTGK